MSLMPCGAHAFWSIKYLYIYVKGSGPFHNLTFNIKKITSLFKTDKQGMQVEDKYFAHVSYACVISTSTGFFSEERLGIIY